jgi:hypothetical protein
MLWIVTAVVVVVVLGSAYWYDRKHNVTDVTPPDRPLRGDIAATSPRQVARFTRRRGNRQR